MISDEQLRVALRSEAHSHDPDLTQLRARFEAGRATGAAGGHLRAGESGRDWSGRRRARPDYAGTPGRRFSPLLRPAVLVAAVVCAVTGLTHTDTLNSLLNRNDKHVSAGQVASGVPTAPTAVPSPSNAVPSVAPKDHVRATSGTGPHKPSKIGAPATAHSPAKTSECSRGNGIVLSPYWLTDNLWAANRGTGSQCVKALSGAGRTVSWSTTWNWSGGPGQVKSFASMVLGWHWGWSVSNSGLPVRTASLNSVPTKWDFSIEQKTPSQLDVAYDLWFHNVPKPTSDNPSAEVRLVLNRPGLSPPGSDGWVGRYFIDGEFWDLYRGTNTWGVYTFVRAWPTTSANLDLKRYIDVARVAGTPGSFEYLSSVQAGADVQSGSGKLTTTAYSVRIN